MKIVCNSIYNNSMNNSITAAWEKNGIYWNKLLKYCIKPNKYVSYRQNWKHFSPKIKSKHCAFILKAQHHDFLHLSSFVCVSWRSWAAYLIPYFPPYTAAPGLAVMSCPGQGHLSVREMNCLQEEGQIIVDRLLMTDYWWQVIDDRLLMTDFWRLSLTVCVWSPWNWLFTLLSVWYICRQSYFNFK